jgi:hypothetical protein
MGGLEKRVGEGWGKGETYSPPGTRIAIEFPFKRIVPTSSSFMDSSSIVYSFASDKTTSFAFTHSSIKRKKEKGKKKGRRRGKEQRHANNTVMLMTLISECHNHNHPRMQERKRSPSNCVLLALVVLFS